MITTATVKAVLIEIGQTLDSFQGKFAVIGGAVPWLLLREAEIPHIGTQDIDLSPDSEAVHTLDHFGEDHVNVAKGLVTFVERNHQTSFI